MQDKESRATTRRKAITTSMQGLKRLLIFLCSVSLLCKTGLASELPIMDGAIAAMSDADYRSESAASTIAHSSKAYTATSNSASPYSDWSKWFRIQLSKIRTAITI